jgi:hypothetical protein
MTWMPDRSWTDLTSNVTDIAGLRLSDHLEELMRPGGAPPELIQPCMHEFTHHWCFFSSLGFAVTGLNYRIAHSILSPGDDGPKGILGDIVASRTIDAVLRPLSEGMALFAEFDVNSFTSPALSTPLRSVVMLFSTGGDLVLDEDPVFKLSPSSSENLLPVISVVHQLRQVRTSDDGIRRKVNVLATRLDQDIDGYLLGYLSVKGMFRLLRSKCERLYHETDLALTYLRSFFFEDMRLIEILLSQENIDEYTLTNRIIGRIQKRTGELGEVTAGDIAEFERHIVSETPFSSSEWASCLHLSLREWADGQAALNSVSERLETPTVDAAGLTKEAHQRIENMRESFSSMLSRRHIVHLGTEPVEVIVDETGLYRVRLGHKELLHGNTQGGVASQSGRGSIEVYFSALSNNVQRVVVIHGPSSLVDIIIPSDQPPDEDDLALVRHNIAPRARYLELTDLMSQLIKNYSRNSDYSAAISLIETQLPEIIENLYLDIGLNVVDYERRDQVIALIRAGGVYALVDHDRELLEALVVLGALAPQLPFKDLLVKELKRQRFTDHDEVIGRLLSAGNRCGFPLVGSDGVEVRIQI